MKTIWKTPLESGLTTVVLPAGAKPISFMLQVGEPCVWWEVDTSHPKEERNVAMVGTGHHIPESAETCLGGVVIPQNGRLEGYETLVFHAYVLAKPKPQPGPRLRHKSRDENWLA